jgi:hypothetical protein
MSNCNHKIPCGCGDVGLTTSPACNTGTMECPSPDLCPETFCAGCVVYCGDSIVDVGINQGDRMDVIMQRLALFLTNPGCITPVNTGAITVAFLTTAGSGYTPSSTFNNVPLLGGTGVDAEATVTTGPSGQVLTVVITNPGTGYLEGDVLIPDPADVGVPSLAAAFTISIMPCRSVLGLHSTSITSSVIKLAWLADSTAVSYQTEYKEATSASWLLNPAIAPNANPVDTIGGLLPNTDYHVRINNICSGGACYSVTILIKTKPLN